MTERATLELLAACLRNQAREQSNVNPAYARVLRARAAMHAERALRLRLPASRRAPSLFQQGAR